MQVATEIWSIDEITFDQITSNDEQTCRARCDDWLCGKMDKCWTGHPGLGVYVHADL